jgi:2,5-diamino-6-(ribosylamino)-4(3H)-pyrimidinone 5'-phosphate reductase
MLPHVVLHVEASLDGRIDWIRPDVGRFYSLAAEFREDAILTGADTLLEGPGLPAEDDAEPPTAEELGGDRPLLAVVDSRGRFTLWNWLRRQPYWRDALTFVSKATPQSARARLDQQGVTACEAGEDQVDLRTALEWLSERHGVRVVRVDSGGGLSGALLRDGLLHEVSVLLEPALVGGLRPRAFVRGPEPASFADVARLDLVSVRRFDDGLVWLRYRCRD